MEERRLEATVIGPGAVGSLMVAIGNGPGQFVAEVAVDIVPEWLRFPNSCFVAVVAGREVTRVEPRGRTWLDVQNRIREVLNVHWDPIGVADLVDDEYDGYISSIYGLLQSRASEEQIVQHLLEIETKRMGLQGSPADLRLKVTDRLLELDLPGIGPAA